ncbi:hypothetical protein HELRODRAFT_74072, partial [Helobdella robusta]|uniref:VWFA domain-containing protein n=1 Tax=Helobdella robusta TaxID=6412 RepID=T1G1M0_HELRO
MCCIIDEKSNEPIPLKKINVNITIKGFVASVESLLTFENNGDKQLEAVFKFPIDDGSAVYKFEADIDGRKIVAECQEKKQAKKNYDAAVQSGHVATLLEEEDFVSDIFICKIGNLLPKKTAVVKFSYVTEISIQADGSLKFVLPTLLNPRYNPDVSKGGLEKSPSIKRVAACDQPYEFVVNATISGLDILNVTSFKDKILSSLVNGSTEVKLQDKFVADHDFELEIAIKEPHKPFAVMEKGSEDKDGILKQDIVMLNFVPELDESAMSSQHEFLFVIDRSGSMDGSRIESAKESLLLFLKSLPPDCYFNIIGFGSTFELLFKEGSEKYTKESLEKALEHQKTLSADLGGTEILEPLVSIYSKPILPTHSRNIFLITDGEVFNTEAVVSLVQKHSHDTRVFTLGIGEGASTALIKGVARAGKGKAEFVKSDDKMSPVVIKLLKCAMQSTFTNIKIDWQLNGASCIQIPKVVPPIFHNDHTVVYA